MGAPAKTRGTSKPEPEVPTAAQNSSAAPKLAPRWIADKIGASLNRYRTVHATAKDPLPLREVMVRIAHCPKLDPAMRRSEDQLVFPEEWLRRFTHGTARLYADRVAAVRALLIAEDYLTEEELSEDQAQGEMLALYGYLGNNTLESRQRFRALPQPLVLRSVTAFGEDTIDLVFDKLPDAPLFTVEELRTLRNLSLPRNQGIKDLERQRLRKGYAFFCTRMRLLHVFLRGGSATDRVNYMEVQPYVSAQDSGDLYLVRLGMPWRLSDSVFREPSFRGGMLSAENCGVRKFEPVVEAASPLTH